MAVIGITSNGNEKQAEFIRHMFDPEKKIIFVEGNAGTGKTFIALASAIQLMKDKPKTYDNHVIFTRDLVQVGEAMGFLPGGIEAKTDPFMACLEDALEAIERIGGVMTVEMMKEYIEVQPINFIRGRSLYGTILIVDEAQNLDLNTLKTVLTRLGDNCKVVLMGDAKQIDKYGQKKKGQQCDFKRVMDALKDREYVAYVHFDKSERSKICAEIDDILSEL